MHKNTQEYIGRIQETRGLSKIADVLTKRRSKKQFEKLTSKLAMEDIFKLA